MIFINSYESVCELPNLLDLLIYISSSSSKKVCGKDLLGKTYGILTFFVSIYIQKCVTTQRQISQIVKTYLTYMYIT